MSPASIGLERHGPVLTIVLSRPERLNALDDAALAALRSALGDAAGSDASVVVITGAGRAFSAGGDRAALGPVGSRQEQIDALTDKAAIVAAIRELPQVTIAAVNGACAGLAIGIAGACQLRYAAEGAVFNTAYLSLGLAGDLGVALALTESIGAPNARDWLLRPRKISARHALAQGFVQDVFPDEGFRETAGRIARGIAELSPVARSAALRNVTESGDRGLPLPEYLRREATRHIDAKLASSSLSPAPPGPASSR
jgi:2-(1,2-epoxy-1,2-dihydrophenyl)acetyl-CoA isomerase